MHDIITLNLELVLQNIDIIDHRFVKIKTAADFTTNEDGLTSLDSIAMRLQFIGECIKRIDKLNTDFFEKHPEIEWRKMMNLRDFISHHYEMLNHEIIFNICAINLPPLKLTIRTILKP